jgi:hypothetical protein
MCAKIAVEGDAAWEEIAMATETDFKALQDQSNLLTPGQREICRQLAVGGAPFSQRALALLAMDQGVTQKEASELSGLTKGQVRYWRDRFRQRGLDIFPDDLLNGARSGSVSSAASQEADLQQMIQSQSAAPAVAKPSKKGKKKQKKAAKGKKAKGQAPGKGGEGKKKKRVGAAKPKKKQKGAEKEQQPSRKKPKASKVRKKKQAKAQTDKADKRKAPAAARKKPKGKKIRPRVS